MLLSNGEESQRRVDQRRVVEISAGDVTTSGYAIGTDLVLTARSAVNQVSTCYIRPLGDSQWSDATVIWRGADTIDAVLLRTSQPLWQHDPSIAWTRWATPTNDGVECVAPAIGGGRAQPSEEYEAPYLSLISGRVGSVEDNAAGRYLVTVNDTDVPAGMVGAALLAQPGRQLLGVVVSQEIHEFTHTVEITPVAVLLRDPTFAQLIPDDETPIEDVTDSVAIPWLHSLLAAPFQPRHVDTPDWGQLLAQHAVTPFVDRSDTMPRLRDWCHATRLFSVAVVTGDAGSGKTRTAAELCVEFGQTAWDSGVCSADAIRQLNAQPLTPDAARPTLIVIDNAESLTDDLAGLIPRLAGRDSGPPVRLLLLARADTSANGLAASAWWRQLCDATTGYLDHVRPTVVALNQSPLSPSERSQHVQAVLSTLGSEKVDRALLPSWDDPAYHQPFAVQLATLLAARGEDLSHASSVLDAFMARQTRQWQDSWESRFGNVTDESTTQLIHQAIALIALTNPNRGELTALLTNLPARGDQDLAALTNWLVSQFPEATPRLFFGPEMLTETLVADTAGLSELLAAIHHNPSRTTHQLSQLLNVLLLACDEPLIPPMLFSLVSTNLTSMVNEAFGSPNATLANILDVTLRRLSSIEQYAETFATAANQLLSEPPLHRHRGLMITLTELRSQYLLRYTSVADPAGLAESLVELSALKASMKRYVDATRHASEAIAVYDNADLNQGTDYARALHNAGAAMLSADQGREAYGYATQAAQLYESATQTTGNFRLEYAEANVTAAVAAFSGNDLAAAVMSIASAIEVLRDSDPDLVELFEAIVGLIDQLTVECDLSLIRSHIRPVRHRSEACDGVRESIIDLAVDLSTVVSTAVPQLPSEQQPLATLVSLGQQLIALHRQDAGLQVLDSAIDQLRAGLTVDSEQLLLTAGLQRCEAAHRNPSRVVELAQLLQAQLGEASFDAAGNASALAKLHCAAGTALTMLGHPRDAADPLRQASELYTAVDDQAGLATARIGIGLCLQELGSLEVALAQFVHAAAILQELPVDNDSNQQQLRSALNHQYRMEALLGKDHETPQAANSAPEQQAAPTVATPAAPQPAPHEAAPVPSNEEILNWILRRAHALDTAEPAELMAADAEQQQLQQRLETSGPDVATIQSYLGTALAVAQTRVASGQAADGLALIQHARHLVDTWLPEDQTGEILRMAMTAVTGECLLALGDYRNAHEQLHYAQRLSAYAQEMPMLYDTVATVQYHLGCTLRESGDLGGAKGALESALDASQLAGHLIDVTPVRGAALATLSAVMLDLGDEASAKMAAEASAVLRPLAEDQPLAIACHVTAANLLMEHQFEQAADSANETLDLLRPAQTQNPLLAALSVEFIGIAYYGLNDGEAWSLLHEGTTAVHAALEEGSPSWSTLLLFHANACACRADIHDQRGETDTALGWLVESMWALSNCEPVGYAAEVVSTVVVPLWWEISECYAGGNAPPRISELFVQFGEHAMRLFELDLALAAPARETLSTLATMADTGQRPRLDGSNDENDGSAHDAESVAGIDDGTQDSTSDQTAPYQEDTAVHGAATVPVAQATAPNAMPRRNDGTAPIPKQTPPGQLDDATREMTAIKDLDSPPTESREATSSPELSEMDNEHPRQPRSQQSAPIPKQRRGVHANSQTPPGEDTAAASPAASSRDADNRFNATRAVVAGSAARKPREQTKPGARRLSDPATTPVPRARTVNAPTTPHVAVNGSEPSSDTPDATAAKPPAAHIAVGNGSDVTEDSSTTDGSTGTTDTEEGTTSVHNAVSATSSVAKPEAARPTQTKREAPRNENRKGSKETASASTDDTAISHAEPADASVSQAEPDVAHAEPDVVQPEAAAAQTGAEQEAPAGTAQPPVQPESNEHRAFPAATAEAVPEGATTPSDSATPPRESPSTASVSAEDEQPSQPAKQQPQAAAATADEDQVQSSTTGRHWAAETNSAEAAQDSPVQPRHAVATTPNPVNASKGAHGSFNPASIMMATPLDQGPSAHVLWTAAQALRDSGRLEEAANCLQEIVRIGQVDVDRYAKTRLTLARTLLESHQPEQAIAEARQLLRGTDDVHARAAGCLIWATAARQSSNRSHTGALLSELSRITAESAASLPTETSQRIAESLAALSQLWQH